jgi:hypothetical protein
MDILWKTFWLSSARCYGAGSDRTNPHKYRVVSSIQGQAAGQHGRMATHASVISVGKTQGKYRASPNERKSAAGKPSQRRT